ncbi:MAG: hypothetical protein ACREOI_37550, partial [bacterium]
INAFSLGLAPIAKLNLNFSLGLERAESKESKRIDKTKRFGAGFNLQLPMNAVLNGDFSATGAEDKAKTNESSNNNLSLQGSIPFKISSALLSGQFFVRYNRYESEALDKTFGLKNKNNQWAANTGFNFSIF